MDNKSKIDENCPLITIVTVTFNANELLESTILSVIEQAYSNIEYIIIDGGSTDGTVDIIKKYSNKISFWISEPDKGVYDAMNKGINKAKGDYIYFIGAGDILLNVLQDIAAKLIGTDSIYYGDVYWVEKQKIYDGPFSSFKLAVKNICHQAIFYPSKALKENNFNTWYTTLADHFLNIQLYGNKKYKFRYIKILVCRYMGGGLSSENPVDLNFFNDRMKIIRVNFNYPVLCYAYLRTKTSQLLKRLNVKPAKPENG